MSDTERQQARRHPDDLQREIELRREDLGASIAELAEEVRGKLNVKERARQAARRGADQARYAFDRSWLVVRTHPEVTGAIAGGLAAAVLVYFARRRR